MKDTLVRLLTDFAESCGVDLAEGSPRARQVAAWADQYGTRHDSQHRAAVHHLRDTAARGWPTYAEVRDAYRQTAAAERAESSMPETPGCEHCRGTGMVTLYDQAMVRAVYACDCPAGDHYAADYTEPGATRRRALRRVSDAPSMMTLERALGVVR